MLHMHNFVVIVGNIIDNVKLVYFVTANAI